MRGHHTGYVEHYTPLFTRFCLWSAEYLPLLPFKCRDRASIVLIFQWHYTSLYCLPS
uniref:Uncharacterized protein n=1 Tax=Mesocestoides corti TaxID=53468 RepID=A0A5K3FHE6_MESCO